MALAAALPVGAAQTALSFGSDDRNIGNEGPLFESGYRYEAVGASWSLQGQFGSSGSALLTFFGIPSAVGNSTTFTRVDGSPFRFLSVDLRGRIEGQPNDWVQARGFLGGVQVASQLLESTHEVWGLEPAGDSFSIPIDTLRLELVRDHGAALMFDNLVLASVPEPSSTLLLGLGLAVGGWLSFRRAKTGFFDDRVESLLESRAGGRRPGC